VHKAALAIADEVGCPSYGNLVRTRADAKADQLRAKHRLTKFLLRQLPTGVCNWSQRHFQWLRHEATGRQRWSRSGLLTRADQGDHRRDVLTPATTCAARVGRPGLTFTTGQRLAGRAFHPPFHRDNVRLLLHACGERERG
jgi:hypothetical protein